MSLYEDNYFSFDALKLLFSISANTQNLFFLALKSLFEYEKYYVIIL